MKISFGKLFCCFLFFLLFISVRWVWQLFHCRNWNFTQIRKYSCVHAIDESCHKNKILISDNKATRSDILEDTNLLFTLRKRYECFIYCSTLNEACYSSRKLCLLNYCRKTLYYKLRKWINLGKFARKQQKLLICWK